MWGAYFKLKSEENLNGFVYDDEKLKKVLGVEFVEKFMLIKEDITLDINMETFERKMHLVNDLLYEKSMFLSLYEKKSKFKHLFRKGHDQNELQKEVSSCIDQRFSHYQTYV